MDPNRWERIKEAFATAVDTNPADREGYLDQAFPADSDIRPEIERLIAQYDAEGDLLGDGDVLGWLSCEGADALQELGLPADGGWDLDAGAARPAFQEGELVAGRFRVARYIGRGGMGEVYEVEDLDLGGRVALKTLRPEFLGDAGHISRFKREVQLARKVTHPNVCRIYDVGRHRLPNGVDLAFLTMEYLQGETLAQYLRRQGRLPSKEALPLIHQMVGGLGALHQAQIIHRDFKPGNVILAEDAGGGKRVVITDFGLARRASEASGVATRVSLSGQLLGTPDYMAPEQLTGKPVSAATDLYALGLVMYEMVVGAKPFRQGEALETAVQRITETPPRPSEHVPGLPGALELTILHCLEKEPGDRPEDAGEVLEWLEAAEPGSARHQTPSKGHQAIVRPRSRWAVRPPSWRSHRLALSVIFSIVVALLAWTTRDRWMTRPVGERERLHVAVLPFTVPGDNPELRAFADGLMENLTSGLSQYEGLNNNLLVVPASEVRRRQVVTAADARSRFNVNYVVQGNLDTQGERVRLQLVLIDTGQMRQIETARVEESRLKAFNLQDGALARLGNLLDLAVRPGHASEQSGLAPGVHEFYLQGLGYLQRSDKTDNIHLAISLFERALEMDGEYALGYAGLAESYRRLYDRTTDSKWIDLALSNCERALELNSHLPKVLVTAGQVYGDIGKYKEALASFSAALNVDARNSEAFEGLARTYTLMERYGEAEATHQKAIMLRPGDWRTHSQLGVFYFHRDEFQKAIESFRTVVALTPDSSQAYSNLAAALHRVGRLEEARTMYERSIEIEPRAKNLSSLGALLSSTGQRKEALKLYERAVEIENGDHGLWGNLGSAYDAIGDPRAREAFLRAAAIAEAMLQVNPGRGELHSALAHYYAGAGDSSRAERWLEKAEVRQSPSPEELANNAATCARLGQLDRALKWSEKALRSGYPAQDLAKRRWLAPLVGDSRFQELQSHYTNRR